MKSPIMLILAGLLLTIGAAAYAQGNPSGSKFVHRGWMGRPTYALGAARPEQNGLRDGREPDSKEQALQQEGSEASHKSVR